MPEVVTFLTAVEINDRNFCIGYSTFAYFLQAYGSVGSLGIASFRVIYVRVMMILY